MVLSPPSLNQHSPIQLIFCDESNYETGANNWVFNKATGLPLLPADAHHAKKCFNSKSSGGVPMAQVFGPFEYTPDYRTLHEQWAIQTKNGKKTSPPEPDSAGHFVELFDKPTTMDLCTWFLASLARGTKRAFYTITDEAIANVQDPEFMADLNNPDLVTPGGTPEPDSGSDSDTGSGSGTNPNLSGKGLVAIDVLSGECLSGLLLHEASDVSVHFL